jgi:hypothetical protein
MYVTLTDIQNGGIVPLQYPLDNSQGELEVALCEIVYYPRWVNISPALGNDKLSVDKTQRRVRSGYYSICSLNEDVFRPIGASLGLNHATGRVRAMGGSIHAVKLLGGLARTLGFSAPITLSANNYLEGNELPRLVPHKELYVKLDQVSTSGNILGGLPSTLLRSVPVGHEQLNCGATVTFNFQQYRPLCAGPISDLKVGVYDTKGNLVDLGYLSVTLHIRDGRLGRTWDAQSTKVHHHCAQ